MKSQKMHLFLLVLVGVLVLNACGSKKSAQVTSRSGTTDAYIEQYREIAVEEMQRTGIPASITLAQGILESGNGNSELSVKGNNHFGIKCKGGWTGRKMYYDDDEKGECFRVYKNAEQSYKDHSEFLVNGYRYRFLFDLDIKDYKGWAKGLKKAGYATNPRYADLLINLIERYELYEYDEYYDKKYKAPKVADKGQKEKAGAKAQKSARLKKASSEKEHDFVYNGIPAVKVKKGDTYRKIADQHDLKTNHILKFNDLPKDAKNPKPGTVLYLKPKRGTPVQRMHAVEKGQSLHDIAQKYGVKIKKLYKYNQLEEGQEPQMGELIALREKVDKAPALRKPGELAEERTALKATMDKAEKPQKVEEVKEEGPKENESPGFPEEEPVQPKPEEKEKPKQPEAPKEPQKPAPVERPVSEQKVTSKTPEEEVDTSKEAAEQNAEADKTEKPKSAENTANKEATQNAPENDAYEIHKVQPGETLYGISRKYEVSVGDIKALNDLQDNNLSTGQELKIKEKPTQKENKVYTVQPGDTLYGISRKFEVSVADLQKWNDLDPADLKPGLELWLQPKE